MSMELKRGRREEKRRKKGFITWRSFFFFLLFYNYSFASAVPRQIKELKLVFPQRFKSLKNEKGTRKILIKCSVIDGVWS